MFFLEVVVPTIVSSVQFPCVIYVNCIMYAICTSLIYLCFVFCLPCLLCILFDTTFYVFHVNFLMYMNMTHDHARAVHWYWYLSSCTDIHMHILILHENCCLYCILLHIIYCNITLIICMAHIFSTIIYHMNFYHIQSTLCFMYYKCYGTVYHYLLHSLLLKVYMYLISINLILFVQSYWLQFHMRYMLYL